MLTCSSYEVIMQTTKHNLIYAWIPVKRGNVLQHRKTYSTFYGTFTQLKRVEFLKKKQRNHAERCLVGVKDRPPWFSVAPMMDCTDNHYRTLARLISKHAWLYTEMVVAETIVHQNENLHLDNINYFYRERVKGRSKPNLQWRPASSFLHNMLVKDRFLAFPPEQHPIVLQIGGSNLENLAKAAKLASFYSYDEINLNCGCPSGKVAVHGCFGARLMFNPKLVGEAICAIAVNSDVPVSVKCRIGVDDRDSYNELCDFISTVSSQSPANHFIIHARKALLSGLSPAENRKIPPLKYEYYFALLRDFPDLQFTLNGGITCIDQVEAAIEQGSNGVMVGRAAYNNPWSTLGHVDSAIYGVPYQRISRRQILQQYQDYADSAIGKYGSRPNIRQLVKPLLGLFHSEPGNSQWKRMADSALRHCKTVKAFLDETLAALPESVLDSTLVSSPSSLEEHFTNVNTLLPPPYIRPSRPQSSSNTEDETTLSGSSH